jgi:hypothetical protein
MTACTPARAARPCPSEHAISKRVFAIPRHDMSGLYMNVSRHEQSGRGECRVPVAPAASCAKCRKHTSVVTTSSPEHPAFPHAMVLTAYFALSPAIGLSCHRRLADTSAKLDAGVEASGPHDFTVPSQAHLVKSAARVHRFPSRVRDDRDTPLHGDGTAAVIEVICFRMETEYFC